MWIGSSLFLIVYGEGRDRSCRIEVVYDDRLKVRRCLETQTIVDS